MLIRQADDVWTHDDSMTLPGGIPFPLRMSVIKLPDGSLLIYSPTRIDGALAEALTEIGPVQYLFAPNRHHHLSLSTALTHFPEARIFGAPGLSEKRKDLRIESLEGELPEAWRDALGVVIVRGAPQMNESVVVHRPSGTLFVGDLVFNFVAPASGMQGFMFSVMGVRGKLAQSRVWSVIVNDKLLAKQSCERLFEHDFDRLVVTHGAVVQTGARAALSAALTRMGGFSGI